MIDQILREGARKILATVLQAEVDAYIAAFADERDQAGRRTVVCNGYHQPRELLADIPPTSAKGHGETKEHA